MCAPEFRNMMGRCPRCQSLQITRFEREARAPDEPATIFGQCNSCQNRWRE